MKEKLEHAGGWIALEFPVRRKSLDDLREQLRRNGVAVQNKLAAFPDSDQNRRVLSHMIGIERWGQSRLRVALGEPFVEEEYNGYRPAREVGYSDLCDQYQETRVQTLEIAQALSMADAGDVKVLHNQWGNLSTKAWLGYLDRHANMESDRMQKD
ncbi:MAG: hypothetical protein J5I90_07875 [Caldilineales bacterium]|nr:hypothetical protein [Caldilineales bacterium]